MYNNFTVHVVVFLILLGGVGYLYYASFDKGQSIFTPEGRSAQMSRAGDTFSKIYK